jgi:hypothetical protein
VKQETVSQIKERFALEHATEVLAKIEAERAALMAAFPDIRLGDDPPVKKYPVRKWTAAQRAEASKRAKAFWASKRKAAKRAASNLG